MRAHGRNARRDDASSPYIKELTSRIRTLEDELNQARSGGAHQQGAGRSKWDFSPASSESGEPWLMTYLDLLTLLLVLFVVMLVFAGKASEPVPPSSGAGLLPGSATLAPDSATSVATTGLPGIEGTGVAPLEAGTPATGPRHGFDDLKLDGLGSDVDVVIEDQTVRLRIASEILFSSGHADLSRPGLAVLQNVLAVVRDTDYIIAVEGHTDPVPIRNMRYPSNWELSGARAGSVVRYLEANGVPSDRLRAIGYADTRPLADNDTADGRARNRRVELIMEQPPAAANADGSFPEPE